MSTPYIFQYQNLNTGNNISINLYTQYESYDVMIDKIGHVTQLSSNFPISYAYTNNQLNIIIPNTNLQVQKKYIIKLNDNAEINFITNANENQELQTKLLSELINRCHIMSKTNLKYPKNGVGSKCTSEQLIFFKDNYLKLTQVYKQEVLKKFDQNYRGQNLTVYFKQYTDKLEQFASYAFSVNQLNYQCIDMFEQDQINAYDLQKLQIKSIQKKFKINNQFDIFNNFEYIYNKFLGKQSLNKRCNTTSMTLQQIQQSLDFLYNKTKHFYLQGIDQIIKIDKTNNTTKNLTKSMTLQNYDYNTMIQQIYITVGLNYQSKTYKYCNLDLLFLPIIIRMFLKKDEQITNLTLNIPFAKISQLKQNIVELQQKQSIYDQLKSHTHIFGLFQKIIKATKQSNLDFAISTLMQLRTKMQKKIGNEVDNVFSKTSVLLNHQQIGQCINDYNNFKLLNIILIKFLVIYQTIMYGTNEIFKQSDNYKSQLSTYQIDLLTISKYLTLYDQILTLQKVFKEYLIFKRNQQGQTRFQWFISQIISMQSLIKMQHDKKHYNEIKIATDIIQKYTISQRKSKELIKLATNYYAQNIRRFSAINYITNYYRMRKQLQKYQKIRKATITIQKHQLKKQIRENIIHLSREHLQNQKKVYENACKIEQAIRKRQYAKQLDEIVKLCFRYKINKIKKIIKIQAYIRMLKQINSYKYDKQRIQKIQKYVQIRNTDIYIIQQAIKTYNSTCQIFSAAWTIQYYTQCYFIENKMIEDSIRILQDKLRLQSAAILIQSYYRMIKQQAFTQGIKNKIKYVQKCLRKAFINKVIMQKSQEYHNQRQKEFIATSKIQSRIKALQIEYAKIQGAKQYLQDKINKYKSTVTIQSKYRQFKCRRWFNTAKAKIIQIQQKAKAIHINNKIILLAAIYYANLFQNREQAAKTIQKFMHAKFTYNSQIQQLTAELINKQNLFKQTVIIQNNIRRYIVQQRMNKVKLSTSLIQNYARQYLLLKSAQQYYYQQQQTFNAAKILQNGYISRKIISLATDYYSSIQKQRNDAQLIISSYFRMIMQRKMYLTTISQCLLIQKSWLSSLEMKKLRKQLFEQLNAAKLIQTYVLAAKFRQNVLNLAQKTHEMQYCKYRSVLLIQSMARMHLEHQNYTETLQNIKNSQKILRRTAHRVAYQRFMIQEAEDLLLLRRQFYAQVLRLQKALKIVKKDNEILILARDYCIEKQQRLNACISIQQLFRTLIKQRKQKAEIKDNQLLSNILPAVKLIQTKWHHHYQKKLEQALEEKLLSENSITATFSPSSDISALRQSLTVNNSEEIMAINEQKKLEKQFQSAAITIQRFYRRDKYFKQGINLQWFKYKLKTLIKAYREYKQSIDMQKQQRSARNSSWTNNNTKKTLLQQLDNIIKVILQANNPLTQQSGWEKILLAFTLNPKLIKEKLVYQKVPGSQNIQMQSFALYYALFASINQLNKGASAPGLARYALQLYKLSLLFQNQLPEIIKHNIDFIPTINITELYCRRQRFDPDFVNRYYINMKFLATYTHTPQIELVGMQLLKTLKQYYMHFYNQLSCVKQNWIKFD